MSQPFNQSEMQERKLELNSMKTVDSDNVLGALSNKETDEAMKLYGEIADVFIKNNTSMEMTYMVLAAMTDSVYNFAVFGDEA